VEEATKRKKSRSEKRRSRIDWGGTEKSFLKGVGEALGRNVPGDSLVTKYRGTCEIGGKTEGKSGPGFEGGKVYGGKHRELYGTGERWKKVCPIQSEDQVLRTASRAVKKYLC